MNAKDTSSGSKVILLVEDNGDDEKLTLRAFKKKNVSNPVVVARDGLEATDLYARGTADLILMDLQMPNLGGLEATVSIRKLEASTNGRIPIIALTAHAMAGDRERCLEAGMDDYLTKPVRSKDLLAKIVQFTAPAAQD